MKCHVTGKVSNPFSRHD